ncbi:MAG: calcium/sodium antiporter [Candidatus Pacebacteria bacterium]|nr:calcium/sodium antiporter [Candidatus Paceibacterota bacterium]
MISITVLVKAADFFTESSEEIGLSLKISPFMIGIAIVSIGTSLPELATSVIAALQGQTEIAAANAVGSNIANIFLVVGLASVVAGKLKVKRSLINLDLPLLATTTTILVFILSDKQVTFIEGLILLFTYLIYFFYIISSNKERDILEHRETEEEKRDKRKFTFPPTKASRNRFLKKLWSYKPKVELGVFVTLIVSAIFIYIGAKYTVESLIEIAKSLDIETGVIAMSAVAIGTSLPELVVSIRAAMKRKYEIALGNVFGSNIFNSLVVVGVPAMLGTLVVDDKTFYIGVPFLIAATLLYLFSGISKKIYNWEGLMYLVLYVLFLLKIFGIA